MKHGNDMHWLLTMPLHTSSGHVFALAMLGFLASEVRSEISIHSDFDEPSACTPMRRSAKRCSETQRALIRID